MTAARLLLLCTLSALSAVAAAQQLPDINRLEVENLRLVLLDAQGGRQGVLEGKYARKRADGRVNVEDAKLSIARQDGSFILQCSDFTYTPATREFEASGELRAYLPDGGELLLPPGNGTFTFAPDIRLAMECKGEATLRTGDGLVKAAMQDPTIDLAINQTAGQADKPESRRLQFKHVEIKGTRGARMDVRIDRLPSVEGLDSGPSVVNLSCFGDASLAIAPVPGGGSNRATVSLLRRARMVLTPQGQPEAPATFEVTCGYLELRGNVQPLRQGESRSTSLGALEIDASQNVRLTGPDVTGSGSLLRFRELAGGNELRLSGEPNLVLARGMNPEQQPRAVHLRASGTIDAYAPAGTTRRLELEVTDRARVQQVTADSTDWLIIGHEVRLFSWQDAGEYSHSFDAIAEGYSPLLRVYEGAVPPQQLNYRLTRATIYGVRAEGEIVGDSTNVRVDGPDVMAVLASDFPLAEVLRQALGLRPRKVGEPPPPHAGRLTLRAASTLQLGLAGQDLSIAGAGQVQLDHERLPRDDSGLVSLTGDLVALDIRQGDLAGAELQSRPGETATATMGYDLLITPGVVMRESVGLRTVHVVGPGRLIARDRDSVAYFRQALGRLPRRAPAGGDLPEPDAGWLDFSGDCRAEITQGQRVLEVNGPVAHLVYGEFELPRAGRTAVNDLAELDEPDVVRLHFIAGRRAVLRSLEVGDGGRASRVNVLRLEGDAVVRSRLDGVQAFAEDAIELAGAEEQEQEQRPFTGVLLGRSELRMDNAAEFFGDFVRGGAFAYDKEWILRAGDRLEVTLRPIDSAGRRGFSGTQAALAQALDPRRPANHRLAAATVAMRRLGAALQQVGASGIELEQPRRALAELERACRLLLPSATRTASGEHSAAADSAAHSALRRADALLRPLVDVAGRGGVHGSFHSSHAATPDLNLGMRNVLVTFNGLGEIVGVDCDGPIEVTRDEYRLVGDSLTRRQDGALVLDNAQVTLPPDSGLLIQGVRHVSLLQRDDTSGDTRTMVTRITGKDMKLQVGLEGK